MQSVARLAAPAQSINGLQGNGTGPSKTTATIYDRLGKERSIPWFSILRLLEMPVQDTIPSIGKVAASYLGRKAC